MSPNLDISKIVRTISSTAEYRQEREKEITPTSRMKRAIGAGALALAEQGTLESGYRTKEADAYNVISHIESFASSQKKLDELRESGARRKEMLPYLNDVIAFNHAVRDMVNNDPSLRFGEVTHFITQMYGSSHLAELRTLPSEARERKLGWFQEATRSTLNGMRHELGAERILGQLTDVSYEETTARDELQGVDFFIDINGIDFPIDIKASQRAAAEAQAKSSHPESIIWSQLTNNDFGDSFHISNEVALAKAPQLRQELQAAYLAA